MKDKKLQVFVSSTFTDLKEERQAAVEQILKSKHIPAGMELFTAGDASQMTIIKKWIDESDVYLLILGGRYGSVEKTSGKSYTHLEFEYAVSTGKPWFAVVLTKDFLNAKVKTLGVDAIEQVNGNAYNDFKAQVMGNLVAECNDLKDIKLAISDKLSEFMDNASLIGWVRGDNFVNNGLIAEEMARLAKENSELREIVNSMKQNDNALYASLTFVELENLLRGELVTYNAVEVNLFDFLISQYSKLVQGVYFANAELFECCKKLDFFKLTSIDRTGLNYILTDDAKNFYLKYLSLNQKK